MRLGAHILVGEGDIQTNKCIMGHYARITAYTEETQGKEFFPVEESGSLETE